MGLNDLGGGVRPGGLRNLSSITVSAIPDSGDLHAAYDTTALSLSDGDSVNTFTDETGNGFDLTGTAPVYKTNVINGNPVVRFDGVDDILQTSFSALSQPNTIFGVLVVRSGGTGTSESMFDSENTTNRHLFFSGSGDSWDINAGATVSGGTIDSNAHIVSANFGQGGSTVRIDGSQVSSGDPGADSLDGFTLGARGDNTENTEVDWGEVLVYPEDKSGIQSDVEQYLSDKWGITI